MFDRVKLTFKPHYGLEVIFIDHQGEHRDITVDVYRSPGEMEGSFCGSVTNVPVVPGDLLEELLAQNAYRGEASAQPEPQPATYGRVVAQGALVADEFVHVRSADGREVIAQRRGDEVLVGLLSRLPQSNAFIKVNLHYLRHAMSMSGQMYFLAGVFSVVYQEKGYIGGLTRDQVRGHFLIHGGNIDDLIS